MWRSKKFILSALLATVLVVGSIGGIALAQDNGDDSQPKTLLARVAEILGIDQQEVEGAFAQARTEMRDEAIQRLVDEGRITQEQADQYKVWLKSMPDMSQYRQQLREWQQTRPGIPPELEEWRQATPNMPDNFGFGGRGGRFHGMGKMRGFGGLCAPTK